MDLPSDLVPPGVHLGAELSWEDGTGLHRTQLRILGDDTRGYLLIGGLAVADDREFWFATLPEAKDAAAALGVLRSAWSDLSEQPQASSTVTGSERTPRTKLSRV